ncbi:MAG: porphobilinogen synthase [Caldisericia bacterium]|nr:porphobilinogen synthase [Caldisericia bacterium]
MTYPIHRLRRLRQSSTIRKLVQDVHLHPTDLIYPIFVAEGISEPRSIPSMPSIFQHPLSHIAKYAQEVYEKGIRSILIFGVPAKKEEHGVHAYKTDGIVQNAIQEIKNAIPELCIISDVCLCSYTTSGHCGIVNKEGVICNDESCRSIAKIALSHAKAGADMVAPSDMMDGRVSHIRTLLDQEGFEMTPILSYSVKYASSYYGPFRDAAECAPTFGDRKTYQMDFARSREAFLEATSDIEEGADMIIVKPALAYLDIIAKLRPFTPQPIVAYSVSGEYSMMKAAAMQGWIQYDQIVLETLLSMKRAGADIIISYSAIDVINSLQKG